jgi:sugar transferase (PEP-CTERM/EpsH1 system associated)
MEILFVTSRLPYPPYRGDRLRTYSLLKNLSSDHAITLVSFIDSENERTIVRELSDFCTEIHLVLRTEFQSKIGAVANAWRGQPLQALYYRSNEMRQTIDHILSARHFDVAYVHLFRMAEYLRQHQEIYRILDLTDVISSELAASLSYRSLPWRALYHFEQPRIARYEVRAAEWYDEVWFVSERERLLMADNVTRPSLHVIPMGIEPRYLQVNREISANAPILFVGNFDVPHNVDAARFLAKEIMPLILDTSPDEELQLVGAGDMQSIAKLGDLPGINVVGFVPNLEELYANCSVFVAPLRFSAGLQIKVLEAMTAAIPVVAAPTICSGLAAVPEEHMLVAQSAEQYAAQVLRLLDDNNLSRRIGENARRFVSDRYSWQTAVDRLKEIAN